MRRLKSVAMLNELLRRSLECETFGTADRCGGQIARPTLSRRLKAPPQVRDGMWPQGQGRSAETLMDRRRSRWSESGQELPSAVTPSRGHESGPPHAAARARRQTPTFGTDRGRRRSSPSGARDQFDSKALDNGSFRSCFRSQTQQKRISHERGAKCVKRLARSERFELPTPRFVVWCSIQLSYERVCGRASRRPGRDGVETASGASLKPSTRLGNRHPRHDASGLAQARPRLFHRGHRFILTRRRPGLQGGNVKQSPDSSIT